MLVVIKGGVVQSVYASDSKVQINILDFDNEELENNELEEQKLQAEIKGLLPIL